AELPLWKIHTEKSGKSEKPIHKKPNDHNVYLLPKGIPYFPTGANVHFVILNGIDEKTAAGIFGIRKRSLFDYITEDILPYINSNTPNHLKENYINLLKSTFNSDECDENLINYLKEREFLPNRASKD